MRRDNKRGFTLVEMMLAIAITLLISGLFVTLIATIRASYYRTYNDNDCADIAALYAETLENTVLYDVQHKSADVIKIGDHSILQNTNTACKIDFSYIDNFNTATATLPDGTVGTIDKWVIRMICDFDSSTGEFRYKFFFLDNYIQPGYLHYVYEGSFWIPNYSEFVTQTIGSNDTYSPTTGGTYGWDYNYSAGSVGYSVTCAPRGEEVGGLFVIPGSMSTSIEGRQIYTRIVNTRTGAYAVDSSSAVTDANHGIPTTSTVITIAEATPGGGTPGGGTPGGGTPGGGTPGGGTPGGGTPGGGTPGGGTPGGGTPGGGTPGGGTPGGGTPGGGTPGGGTPGGGTIVTPPDPVVPSATVVSNPGNATVMRVVDEGNRTVTIRFTWPSNPGQNEPITIDVGVTPNITGGWNGSNSTSGTTITVTPNAWQTDVAVVLTY